MTTLHLDLDVKVVEAARKKAEGEGKTLETWVGEMMAKQTAPEGGASWVANFLASAERNAGNSDGRTLTREEIYDR